MTSSATRAEEEKQTRWRSSAGLAAVILIAVCWLYRSPWAASDLPITPDSVEYAVAPAHLLETGHYAIVVEGRELPPRYPPWFSVLVILPAYLLFGTDPGNAIIGVTLFAAAGIGLAWFIGRAIAGPIGGTFASLAVLLVPSYTAWGKQVMSDVPAVTLFLAAAFLFLRLRSRADHPLSLYFVAGTIVTVAVLFRPVFAAMVLPFAWAAISRWRVAFVRLIAFGLPLAAGAVATFWYNAATFGSALRNGYKLWVPVPCDYPALMFSLRNVPMNARVLMEAGIPLLLALGAVVAILLRVTGRDVPAHQQKALKALLWFVALTTLPMLLFHLFYFFPSDRFHIPLLTGVAIAAGSAAAWLIPHRFGRVVAWVLAAVLIASIARRAWTDEPMPVRRLVAEQIKRVTPPGAMVISAIEPVYLEHLAGGANRRIVPASRRVEYASKLLAWNKINDPQPPPRNWRDSRAEGLLRGGAVEAVEFVASERLDQIVAIAATGTPVYLEAAALNSADAGLVQQVEARFRISKVAPFLFRLEPR